MRQIKITLPEYWDNCPTWRKMLELLDKEENIDEWGNISDTAIRQELKKIGARWSAPTETIIFPNEKSYALWLLRFS